MKVSYQRGYPVGPFLQERIGMEIEIPDDGDPIDEIHTLKELCDKAHRELNPNLYDGKTEVGNQFDQMMGNPMEALNTITTKKDSKEEAIQSHIKTIGECRTIQNLNIFKPLVENTNDPRLTEAYHKRLNELQ